MILPPQTTTRRGEMTARQWLSESLGVEAQYHAVYQMTRYRLKAKLKVVRPQHIQQNRDQREAFKQTSKMTSTYRVSTLGKCARMSDRFATLHKMRAALDCTHSSDA